jgi:hypothetical protein
MRVAMQYDKFESKYDIVGYLNDGIIPRTVEGEKARQEQARAEIARRHAEHQAREKAE